MVPMLHWQCIKIHCGERSGEIEIKIVEIEIFRYKTAPLQRFLRGPATPFFGGKPLQLRSAEPFFGRYFEPWSSPVNSFEIKSSQVISNQV